MTTDHNDTVAMVKHGVDAVAAGGILGAFVGVLPPLAAFVAVLWYAIQIWESETVQGWVHRHKVTKRLRQRHRRHVAQGRPTPPRRHHPPRGNPPFGNE